MKDDIIGFRKSELLFQSSSPALYRVDILVAGFLTISVVVRDPARATLAAVSVGIKFGLLKLREGFVRLASRATLVTHLVILALGSERQCKCITEAGIHQWSDR